MYYKFKAFKNNIENEKYSIDVFDRKQRDYYTKQYNYYLKEGIIDNFAVTSCYEDSAIKSIKKYLY